MNQVTTFLRGKNNTQGKDFSLLLLWLHLEPFVHLEAAVLGSLSWGTKGGRQVQVQPQVTLSGC